MLLRVEAWWGAFEGDACPRWEARRELLQGGDEEEGGSARRGEPQGGQRRGRSVREGARGPCGGEGEDWEGVARGRSGGLCKGGSRGVSGVGVMGERAEGTRGP